MKPVLEFRRRVSREGELRRLFARAVVLPTPTREEFDALPDFTSDGATGWLWKDMEGYDVLAGVVRWGLCTESPTYSHVLSLPAMRHDWRFYAHAVWGTPAGYTSDFYLEAVNAELYRMMILRISEYHVQGALPGKKLDEAIDQAAFVNSVMGGGFDNLLWGRG